jgi:pimeloyl-ACP methyl ester carboxylesterase
MDVATHPFNNSLVILIHGVMSNRYLAWETAIDLIQSIHGQGSASLSSYDYYAFEYESGYFHQPSINEAFAGLRKLIDRPRYDSVVLIGHSQGGVLAKLFILDQLLEQKRGQDLKVDLVITLDSPHRGPQPWIYPIVVIGGLWKWIPFLRKFPLFRQIAELGFASRNLRRLKKHWREEVVPQDACPAEPQRRWIPSYTLSGTRLPFPPVKLVVSDRSAFGFKVDQPIRDPALRRREWALGHGVQAMKAYQQQIEQRLLDNDYEATKEIERAPAAESAAAIGVALGNPQAADLPCWERRFAEGFPLRPLRRLGFQAAVEKFIELRKDHP